MPGSDNKLKQLIAEVRRYFDLSFEYVRLTAAEKTALLLTTIALALVVGVLACLIFFFISIAIVYWLGELMPIALAYTIVAAFYVLGLIVVLVFRRTLLLDPVARFVSKLFMR